MSLAVEAAHRLRTMKETKYIRQAYNGNYCYVSKRKGIYKYDECGMIWNLLEDVEPAAFREIQQALHVQPDVEKPTASQLHHFFRFRHFEHRENEHFERIKSMKEIQPGDILSWQAKVALILEAPVEDGGYGPGICKVKVVDSKQVPNHDEDSRPADERCFEDERGTRTGMGTGYIGMKEEGGGYFALEVDPKPGRKFHFESTGAVVARPY